MPVGLHYISSQPLNLECIENKAICGKITSLIYVKPETGHSGWHFHVHFHILHYTVSCKWSLSELTEKPDFQLFGQIIQLMEQIIHN